MVLAVTGHRSMTSVPDLTSYFETLSPTLVLTGMAIGFDQHVCRECIRLSIPFTACIPCQNQDRMWPPHAKTEYAHLLSLAARRVLVSDQPYSPRLMHLRNEFMVDRCAHLLAYYDGSPTGGTAACIRYARSRHTPMTIITP